MKKKGIWENLEVYLILVTMVALLAVTVVELVARLANSGVAAVSKQLITWLFAYMVFCALGWCAKNNIQMQIDVLPEKYPPAIKKFVKKLASILVLAMGVAMLVLCCRAFVQYIQNGLMDEVLGLPTAILGFAPILGFALMVIRMCENLFLKKSAKEEK